jgi:N utilization substance protein A
VEKLMLAGIPTVERLGSMTPEQLEEIEGIDPDTVEGIQLAVNSYYVQFEGPVDEPAGEPVDEPVEAAAEDSGTEELAAVEEITPVEVEERAEIESVTIADRDNPEPK